MKFNVEGRADLDGTHKVVLETNSSKFHLSLERGGQNGKPLLLKIQSATRACGCILAEAKRGTTDRAWLDRFKLRHMQIRDGDSIDIEPTQFVEAQRIELQVPTGFLEKDTARFIGKPVAKGEKTVLYTFSGEPRLVEVRNAQPEGIVVITSTTAITISSAETAEVPVTYKDIGGLSREIKRLREVVEYPIRFPHLFEHLGVAQPKGVILYGPPGTGKTLLAKALANEVGAKFYSISGPEIFSKWYGESEAELRTIFDTAQKNAPSVVLIDELDALAPKREKTYGELERRVVTTLLTQMDGLKELRGVVVVATTNAINTIDTALRREGRFGQEINIGVPDSQGRKEILEIHTRKMPLAPDVNLDLIAEKTNGFVGADILSLCREAAYNTLRRSFPSETLRNLETATTEGLKVCQSDFEGALPSISPSAMRELHIEIPKVSWEDIGGLDDVKQLLVKNITYSLTKQELLLTFGLKPVRGILLYGPPGTGKTMLAKAVASQCGVNFIGIKGPEIRSKWFGESEERIRFLFAKAREVAPCVMFFDEIDAAAPARGRDIITTTDTIVNQILAEMDGIESCDGVFVMGATNRVELLDSALLRPGRFEYQVEVPLPASQARQAIFSVCLRKKPISSDVNLGELAQLTDGFSGADIAEVCRAATWAAIEDANFEAPKVELGKDHLRNAIYRIKRTKDKLNSIETFREG